MQIVYEVPVTYVAEDDFTYINKSLILIKDCSVFGQLNTECDGFNFNKCPNDDNYCQPYQEGDTIYIQFKIDTTIYNNYSYQFINSVTGEEFDASSSVTEQKGFDSKLNFYVNIIVNLTNFAYNTFDDNTCWYLKLKLCRDAECNDYDYITTEPYCLVKCNEKTLLFEGSYTDWDCDGKYYGELLGLSVVGAGGANSYIPQVRIRGVVEPDGFEFTETKNRIKTVKSQQRERFILYTEKIPYYEVKRISSVFNSKIKMIDGIVYTDAPNLNKNFEDGSMWIIKESLFIDCDEINFTCSINP